MDENQKRRIFQYAKSLSSRKFWSWMNGIHTKAYAKAEQHYQEAMEIILQPKQRNAVIRKAEEIREQWDGLRTITVDDTEEAQFKTADELIQGLSTTEAAIYKLEEETLIWISGKSFVVRPSTGNEVENANNSVGA